MATENIQDLLKAAIASAKAGNKGLARQQLEQVLKLDDNNETAWLWMATVLDDPAEKRVALQQVLEINPNNPTARQAILRLPPAPSSPQAASAARNAITGASSGASGAKTGTGPLRPTPAPAPAPKKEAPVRIGTPGSTSIHPRTPRRRIFTLPFIFAGIVAILMILAGLYLLTIQGNPVGNSPALPTNVQAAEVGTPVDGSNGAGAVQGDGQNSQNGSAGQPPAAQSTVAPSRTPVVTVPVVATISTLDPNRRQPLPTITPSPTIAITPPDPTATLPPAVSYSLMFIGEGRGAGEPGLFRINGDGTGETRLLSNVSSFSIAHDRRIAFVRSTNGIPQLYVGDAEGRNGTAITQLTGHTMSTPSWSPNSDRIVFASDDTGTSEIYIVDADGSNLTRLTDNKIEDRDPAWSPIGDTIVYSSDTTGKNLFQLFTMALSDRKPVQLTSSTGSNYKPAWNDTGIAITFVSTRDRFEKIYIITMGSAMSLTSTLPLNDGNAPDHDPVWSPDGRYILYNSVRNNQPSNLFLTSVDGRVTIPVTQMTDAADKSYGARFVIGQ